MTKPKWMRKRKKVTDRLDSEMRLAWQRGELSWKVEGERRKVVSFKKEDGTTDKNLYIRFFTSVLALINESYINVRKGELSRKEEKFLLYEDELLILIAAIDAIYEKWDEIEKELLRVEEIKINEVSV